MKTRRVGSLTCGALLIIFGVLFMVHMFVPALKYEFIIKFWPVILIALGVEMLLSCRNKEEGIKLKYDGAAIFLTILPCSKTSTRSEVKQMLSKIWDENRRVPYC